MERPKPLILLILDGFGVSTEKTGNPVMEAKKPCLEMLERNFPMTTLQASGTAVGLPWGEAGNSEVGHLTMGAGRVIYHSLPRIINSIADGSFFKNEAFLKAAEHVRQNKSRLHIFGLVSSGSVHSYIDHLYAIFEFTKRENIAPVYLHIFTDGKDAPPKEAADFLEKLDQKLKKDWPNVKMISVIGRFYSMDRQNKWDRTEKAYKHLVQGEGEKISSIPEYIRASYAKNIADEFIEPAYLSDFSDGFIKEKDALIITDFREDSMRQITHALADEKFDYFNRGPTIPNLLIVTMTEYEKGLQALPAFPKLDIRWPLVQALSAENLRHLHIAETQKYAHVTYFFNGGIEKPFIGEERILIPSLEKHFDEVPEMRTREITNGILENFDKYDVIIANFANTDMVGHSGNYDATIKAVEVVDECLKQLVDRVLASDGTMLITADHGNAEHKRDLLTGEKTTEHSTNPVYFILVGKKYRFTKPASEDEVDARKKDISGILVDVAPTILELLIVKKPQDMTGHSLLEKLLEKK